MPSYNTNNKSSKQPASIEIISSILTIIFSWGILGVILGVIIYLNILLWGAIF